MKIKTRGLTSLLLAGAFTLAAVSGAALYLKPKGRVANWTGWTFGGLDKGEWEALHTNACLLLLVVACFHLVLNWKTFSSYLRQRAGGMHLKLEIAIASAVLIVVAAGTVAELPPFSATTALGDRIKKYWEESADMNGPAPHAEEFTIDRFARAIGLTSEQLVDVLKREGLKFHDSGATIGQVAEDNELTPAELYTAITKHHSKAIHDASMHTAAP